MNANELKYSQEYVNALQAEIERLRRLLREGDAEDEREQHAVENIADRRDDWVIRVRKALGEKT